MRINQSKELLQYINELIEINNLNLSVSDLLLSLLGNRELANKKEIELLKKSSSCSEKDILLSKIVDYLDIDMSFEDNEEIFERYIASSISEVDINKYQNNPYYRNIKICNIKDKDFELIYDHYQAYEIFPYLDMDVDSNYHEINSLGYFKEDFPFIALNYQGVTWMSITPNEIETMSKALEAIKGSVTVFGLGLGYFAYMALLKEEVKKVIIIEKDPNIVALFKKHLLPQFPNTHKLQIILDDALNYLSKDLSSDYAFIDLWHEPNDGIPLFLKFKKAEKKQSKCKFLYWLESSFYLFLRRCFIALLEEQLNGFKDHNYKKAETINDEIINQYYFKTKNLVISNKAQLSELLSNNILLDLLLND